MTPHTAPRVPTDAPGGRTCRTAGIVVCYPHPHKHQMTEDERIRDCAPLANWLAARFAPPTLERADARQLAMIGILHAVRKHNPQRGKLTTIASVCVRSQFSNFATWRRRHELPTVFLEDIIAAAPPRTRPDDDPAAVAARRDQAARLHRLLATLPERDRIIIRERFWKGRSRHQVADAYHLTRERVRQIERDVLTWLRKQLQARWKRKPPGVQYPNRQEVL